MRGPKFGRRRLGGGFRSKRAALRIGATGARRRRACFRGANRFYAVAGDELRHGPALRAMDVAGCGPCGGGCVRPSVDRGSERRAAMSVGGAITAALKRLCLSMRPPTQPTSPALFLSDGSIVTVLAGWAGAESEATFLRALWSGACEIFGTVLGPGRGRAASRPFPFRRRRAPLRLLPVSAFSKAR